LVPPNLDGGGVPVSKRGDSLTNAVLARSSDVFDARIGLGLGSEMTEDEIKEIEKDGDQFLDWADALGMSPVELQTLLKRRGAGFEGTFSQQIEKARREMARARRRRADVLNSQSRDERKALAVARLEMCFNGLMSIGAKTQDAKSIKMAATVALDIARVDGSLNEKTTTETVLEIAAAAIREKKLAQKSRQLTEDNELRVIDAAIVSTGVREDGRGELQRAAVGRVKRVRDDGGDDGPNDPDDAREAALRALDEDPVW
jgi:hypothetical protein